MSQLDLPRIAESQALAYVTSNDADALLESALCEENVGHDATSGNITLTEAEFRAVWHHVIDGSPAAGFDFIVPAGIRRPFMVTNISGETATVKTGGGASGQVLDTETRLFYSDGTDIRSLSDTVSDGSGGSGHDGALVVLTSDLSVPNASNTIIGWGNEAYDTGDYHDNVTNNSRLTVPAGVTKVIVSAQVSWASNASGSRETLVFKNGSSGFDGQPFMRTTAQSSRTLQNITSPVLAVTAGDYFELVAWQNSGATRTIESNSFSWFSLQALE